MESRSHRAFVLAIVVVLHVPLLWWLQAAPVASPRTRSSAPLVIEFLLQAPDDAQRSNDPALQVQRRRGAVSSASAPAAPRSALRVVEVPSAPREADTTAPAGGFIGDDGRLRVSKHLMDELDAIDAERAAQAAREARTWTIPLGEQRILEHKAPSIDVDATRFSKAWKPSDMNPLEEACWRNKGLAFAMSMLGSMDCAYPGSKPKPVPEMIHYGRDDGDEILRKTREWEEYDRG